MTDKEVIEKAYEESLAQAFLDYVNNVVVNDGQALGKFARFYGILRRAKAALAEAVKSE